MVMTYRLRTTAVEEHNNVKEVQWLMVLLRYLHSLHSYGHVS